MDVEDTQKQKKIRELKELVAQGLKGLNTCRYRDECPFARQRPAVC